MTTTSETNDIEQTINTEQITKPEITNSTNDVSDTLDDGVELQSLEEKYETAQITITELENKIKTLTSVAATSQSQYLSLKSEFDST